nr:hypothetical protein [uncultured Duganella sp.]
MFAYPNGKPGADYHRRHVDMVRPPGFEAAPSTVAGTAGPAATRGSCRAPRHGSGTARAS